MMTTGATTSIIICVYTLKRWGDICEAVQSARLQEPPPTEIVLVCDHNLQLKAMCEAEFPDAVVVENKEPTGLSEARNSGIAAARGSIVAFLDDDAVADRHYLARLVAQVQQPGVIASTARFEPMWIGARPAWFPDEFLWVVGCTYRGMPLVAALVRNTTGGGMCAYRELFHRVGGFSHRLGRTRSKLPFGCEETELCIRARRAMPDACVIYEPAAFGYHKVTPERLTLGYFVLRCYAGHVESLSHDAGAN